jgi:hypothetical protein
MADRICSPVEPTLAPRGQKCSDPLSAAKATECVCNRNCVCGALACESERVCGALACKSERVGGLGTGHWYTHFHPALVFQVYNAV